MDDAHGGLLGASFGVWMAAAWPYRLDVGATGLELTFVWGRREFPWSAVDGFRYFGIWERLILGYSGAYVRLRYRPGSQERPRVAVATFYLPVMDVGSPTGEPVYATLLDRYIPDRRVR